MNEFNSRIDVHRIALAAVNKYNLFTEPLFSLANKSIDRWISVNKISANDPLLITIIELSKKLFFLSNKSQEQITDDYIELNQAINKLIADIDSEMEIKLFANEKISLRH